MVGVATVVVCAFEPFTAAAAAAAYRIGGSTGAAGRDCGVGRPALTTLAIGVAEKLGFGGGFAVDVQRRVFIK